MSQTNFLIGRGELLTHDIKGPKRRLGKAEVYTLAQAARRLNPQFSATATMLDALPTHACPGDFGVARLTMNPSYIARSFFPVAMMRSVGLESVGSRTVKVTPGGWTKKGVPQECTTTELFIAGKRQAFRHLNDWTQQIEPESDEALDLAHIEQFSAFTPDERMVNHGSTEHRFFEVGIHLLPNESHSFVQQSFVRYAKVLHEMNTFKIVNTLENIERQCMLHEVIEETQQDIELCENLLNESRLIQHFALSQLSRFFLKTPRR